MLLHAFFSLGCAMLWAGNTVASKLLPATVPALTFAFIRYSISVACMLPFIQKTEYKNVTRSRLPALMFLGFSIVLIFNILFFNAVHMTSPISITLISATHPILTLLVSAYVFGRIPTKYQLFAFMLSFAGVALVITQGKMGLEIFTASPGELLALAGVITQVAYTIMLKKISEHFSPLFLAFATGVSGLLFVLPFIMNYNFLATLGSLSRYHWGLFFYLGIFGTGFGMILYSMSVKRKGAELSSLIVYSTMPIFVSIFSFFLLGDHLSVWQMSGGALVLAALVIGIKKGHH